MVPREEILLFDTGFWATAELQERVETAFAYYEGHIRVLCKWLGLRKKQTMAQTPHFYGIFSGVRAEKSVKVD